MYCHSRVILVLLSLIVGAVPLVQAQSSAAIEVNANRVVGPVNRLVFGQNVNAADNAYIFSSNTTDLNLIQRGAGFWDPAAAAPVPDVVRESKAIGTSLLRYPGGCLVHNFDWRKSVGPDAKANGWLFGLDEYLTLCRAIGAIPLITISDYVLPADEVPGNAAALVEYLNSPADAAHPWAMRRSDWGHPAPYKVIWFELGNESMHGNHRVLPHRQYNAEEYAAYANAVAAAIKRVDPRIKLGIVMVPGPGNDVNCDWNRTVVRLAGATAAFVSIHMYAPEFPKAGISQNVLMQSMMVAPQHIEERLAEYHQMIREQLGHDLPLAVTEFNGALNEPNKRLGYGNALECADLLRVFLKPESNVILASYWDFINGPFGMLRTNMGSPDGEPTLEEPAFLLYKLWAQHFGGELLAVDVQSPLAEFPGAGSEQASRGAIAEARTQIQTVELKQYSSVVGALWPKLLNVQIHSDQSNFNIHLDNLTRSIYPVLARIPRPPIDPGTPVEFSVSFDAKLTPDPGSDVAPMGIGLMDSRGWNQTHSGIGVDSITTKWKHFDARYRLDPLTPSVDLTVRLMAAGKNVSGMLQIDNLAVTEFRSAQDPAYPVLTSSASISSNHQKLYLIVFNKSTSDPIAAKVVFTGFSAAAARYWEVNGPDLDSTTDVTETVHGAEFPLRGVIHVFPAHSMTAIEFSSAALSKAE